MLEAHVQKGQTSDLPYVQKGQTSDLPGLDYYVHLGTTRSGCDQYRCLRSNSPIEGWHCHLRRGLDSCAKHSSPRIMHSRLMGTSWRWTIKAMVHAGLLPPVGHFELHLRDRLCDLVRGTALAAMRRLERWQRVDQSKAPTVPRGIHEGLFSCGLVDEAKKRQAQAAPEPHCLLRAPAWFEGTVGHAPPSDLTGASDLAAVLQHPDVVVTDGTKGDSAALHEASGILAAPATIASLPAVIDARRVLNTNLAAGNHVALQSQLTQALPSWQHEEPSVFTADEGADLGSSAPLPAFVASGSSGAAGETEVVDAGDAVATAAAGSSSSGGGGQGERRLSRQGAYMKKKRLDPEYMALNKKKYKHQHYKRNGGGMDIAEWEGAGMPTRPLPPPPPL